MSRRMHARRTTHRSAFSLVEVVIAGSLLLILIAAALSAFAQSNDQLGQSMVIADVSQRANRIEDQVQELLRSAGQFDLDDEKTSDSIPFDRINFNTLTGMTYSPTQRAIVWRAENDGDAIANDGRLELWSGGAKLFDLGNDVMNDFRVEYWQPASTTASNGQTPGDLDQEVRLTFRVVGVLGMRNGALELHEERREVRVWIRNR